MNNISSKTSDPLSPQETRKYETQLTNKEILMIKK